MRSFPNLVLALAFVGGCSGGGRQDARGTVHRVPILDGGGGDYVLFLPETVAVAEIHGLTLRNAEDCIYPNAHFRLIRSVIRGCPDWVDQERGSGGLPEQSVDVRADVWAFGAGT